MRNLKLEEQAPAEGRRERKRRETRERIAEAAKKLFLKNGFDGTTIEDITEAADVSKRTFFGYFPSKEDLIFAWQDTFGDDLAEAVLARAAGEPLAKVAEEALLSMVALTMTPQAIALGRLKRETPSLCARDHVKYANLEAKLAEALLKRVGEDAGEQFRARLLAMIVVGAMRIGGEAWHAQEESSMAAQIPENFGREVFRQVSAAIEGFSKR
ncbi:TetR family transcriptional regulator [Oxalobacteraceae bacterium CAVE-383]|nr:TetR family transcriptional regulator [Oxalobacteraceae bacterium CAVE-383]